MKRLLIAAATLSAAIAQPAIAEVIVQQGTNGGAALGALPGFDYSLGSLDAVSLTIAGTENRSGFVIGDWPQGAPATMDLNWSIAGTSNFTLYLWPVSQGSVPLTSFAIPIAGAGQDVISDEDRLFEMWASGEATFSIDPSVIPQLGSSGFFDWDLALRFFGPGFYDGSDITFGSVDPLQPIPLGGTCFGGSFQGEELCNFFTYTLSYIYTPQAVPEPSTWAMMLLGFGAVGFAMRKRKQTKPPIPRSARLT
jgi:PEP-CTERM motif